MKRLLVIEDDPEVREALVMFLDHPQVELLTAASGLQGVKTTYERAPDVVLLDVTLPDVDGFEVFSRLAATAFQPRVFFMTALTAPEVVSRMRACAAHGILTKPFPDDLRSQVLQALEVKETEELRRWTAG